MANLNADLERLARTQGIDYYGIAELRPVKAHIETQGGPIVAAFPRAIAIGIRLFDGLVDMASPETRFEISPYIQHIYDVVSPRLNVIALNLAMRLRDLGFEALPLPSGLSGRNTSLLSFKLVARLAGLGWIGKNCLLITPECGPRVRFGTVLTTAPLEAGKPLNNDCGDCRICVDSCPVHAFTGREFRTDEPREARFDATKCEIFRGTDVKFGLARSDRSRQVYACGMCVKVCPYGAPHHS